MIDVIKVSPRGVGSNAGWASLVTGQHVDFGPDLSMFVRSRADAYRLVDWVTPQEAPDGAEHGRWKRVDRAKVDYRDFEPGWLQVKLIVEEEHRVVLERLAGAIYLRDGYLDEKLIRWAIDPLNNCDAAKAYQALHREEFDAMRAARRELAE